MKKNDIFDITIEDMGHDGAGIGKVDGYALFVKDALIGDKVRVKIMKAKKNYAFARLMEVLEPSLNRVEPACPVARPCGGCQIQSMKYEAQLEFKRKKVLGNLEHIGGFSGIEVKPTIGMDMPYRYRNKTQFPIGKDKDGNVVAGFYAGRTHSVIACEDCLLGNEINRDILLKILDYMRSCHVQPYDEETGAGLVRHCLIRKGFATGEIMICIVANGRKLPKAEVLASSLREISGVVSITLNVNTEKTNVILGNELITLWGQDYITDKIGDVAYQISPLAFYQVNPVQTKTLYDTALDYAGLTGNETVWDLYCGIGTISLFLARKAKKVYGVEIVPAAIENAKENARLNGIANAEFFVGKSEDILPAFYEETKERADVIVVDPPRKGCDQHLLDTILKMQPERVVYVSCDSATLARDLKILSEGGYKVEKVQPVDMFPQTVHVETVCLLSKLSEAKNTIDVKVDMDELNKTTGEKPVTQKMFRAI